MRHILTLSHVSFGFAAANPLLNDLSFEVERGKIYALMGGNGSGKTTLLNILSGFIKPQRGSIFFSPSEASKKVVELKNKAPYMISRYGISRSFQDLRLIGGITVKENAILGSRRHPSRSWYKSLLPERLYQKDLRALRLEVNDIMSHYFLHSIQDAPADAISYGQQKLVNLATSAAAGADLLLLDEPLAGLNPEYKKKIITLLAAIKQTGKTIIMIEHHTESVSQLADRIIFLHQGKIQEYDNYTAFSNDPAVLNVYL